MSSAKFIASIVSIVFGSIEVLIGLRIVLKLIGASVQAQFVRWVYLTTQPLLKPFMGMFPSPSTKTGIVLEFSALFALVVYSIVGLLIIKTLNELARSQSGSKA